MGMNLAILSIIGIVALSGVVVNDSLVMVDFINRYKREDGKTSLEAALAAGPRRFRPILLTSITTLPLSQVYFKQSLLWKESKQSQNLLILNGKE